MPRLILLMAAAALVVGSVAAEAQDSPTHATVQHWDIYAATGANASATQNPVRFGTHPTDGTLWFVGQHPSLRLGSLNPALATNNYRQWAIPGTGAPTGMALGANDVWMTIGNTVVAKILRTTGQEVLRTFSLPAGLGTAVAQRLALTPDGDFAYVPVKAGAQTSIYRIPRGGNTVSATVTAARWAFSTSSDDPRHVVVDGDNKVWIANAHTSGSRIQRLDPAVTPDATGSPRNLLSWLLPTNPSPVAGLFVVNGPTGGAAVVCAVAEGAFNGISGRTTCLQVATNTFTTFVCAPGTSCLDFPQELARNVAGELLVTDQGGSRLSFVGQAAATSSSVFVPPTSAIAGVSYILPSTDSTLTSLAASDSAAVTPTTLTVAPGAVTNVNAEAGLEPGHVTFPLGLNSRPVGISRVLNDAGTTGSGTVYIAQSFTDGSATPTAGAIITKLVLGGTPPAAFQVQPASLSFEVSLGGTVPAPALVAVSRVGSGDPLSWRATLRNQSSWLTLSSSPACTTPQVQACGSTASPAAELSMAFSQSAVNALQPNTYTDVIDIVDPSGGAAPVSIAMTLHIVRRPTLVVLPSLLRFDAVNTDTTPPGAQPLTISSTCEGCTASEALIEWTATVNLSVPARLVRVIDATTTVSGTTLSGTGPVVLQLQIECLSGSACIPGAPVPNIISGEVLVTSGNAANSPQHVPIEYHVTAVTQTLVTDRASLEFAVQRGESTIRTETFRLYNLGAGPVAWGSTSTYVNDQFPGNADYHPPLPPWLTLTPSQGVIAAGGFATIEARVNPAHPTLADAGNYSATIALDDDPGDSHPAITGVVAHVLSGQIALNPQTTADAPLTATVARGNIATVPFTVSNPAPGDGPLVFTPFVVMNRGAGWLRVLPAGAATVQPGATLAFTVEADATALEVGDYTGQVIVQDPTSRNQSQTLFVKVTVTAAGIMTVTPSAFPPVVVSHGSTTQTLLSISVGNVNSVPLSFTAQVTAGAPWLTIEGPSSGSAIVAGAPATLQVKVNPTGRAIGTYTGTVTITGAGATHSVNVDLVVRDTTAPTIVVPPGIQKEATGPLTPVVFSVTVTDNVDANPSVSCNPVSGSGFAVGTHTVVCTAVDAAANTASASFVVTVRDTTPPVLTLPAPIAVTATSASGATVNFAAQVSALDLVSGAVPVTCAPASGSVFSVGTTTVNCSASDGVGNQRNGSFTVTVSPLVQSLVVAPSSLSFTGTRWTVCNGVKSGTSPASKSLVLTNSASGTVWYLAVPATTTGGSWMAVTPTTNSVSANGTRTVTVSVNTDGLAAGSYAGSVTVYTLTSATQSPTATTPRQVVPVTLQVNAAAARLCVTPGSLSFGTLKQNTQSVAKSVSVTNVGDGAMPNWVASTTATSGSLHAVKTATGNAMQVHVKTATSKGNKSGVVTIKVGTTTVATVSVTWTVSSTAGSGHHHDDNDDGTCHGDHDGDNDHEDDDHQGHQSGTHHD
jgi:hypothetical protein